jgi:hypothetical protein
MKTVGERHAEAHLKKYNEDQERDEHGRFGSGGGETKSSSDHTRAGSGAVMQAEHALVSGDHAAAAAAYHEAQGHFQAAQDAARVPMFGASGNAFKDRLEYEQGKRVSGAAFDANIAASHAEAHCRLAASTGSAADRENAMYSAGRARYASDIAHKEAVSGGVQG